MGLFFFLQQETDRKRDSIADFAAAVKMFKPSQPMLARLRLTTKQVNGGYYKGTRSGSMGYFAKNGSYVIDWKKVRTYVVPENLKEFKLTPFVTKVMAPTRSR